MKEPDALKPVKTVKTALKQLRHAVATKTQARGRFGISRKP
jgi:hypothetical protein